MSKERVRTRRPGLMRPAAWRRIACAVGAVYLAAIGLLVVGTGLGACARKEKTEPVARRLPSKAAHQTSESCRACHPEIFAAWEGTDHALANQPVEEAELDGAFTPARDEADGGSRFHVARGDDGRPLMVEQREGDPVVHPVEAVLGYTPSRQMLVPAPGGRWQPVDLAWDAARREWFNVFGSENRQPGEWGHWTGRGMNWNSMCAHCHMTGYRKNYDPASDGYRSTWVEHGIGCIECHGPMDDAHGRGPARTLSTDAEANWIRDRHQAMDTCARCHARNELLTAEFPPGADYHDHFRLELPVREGAFWPDGQQREEVFHWASMQLSRMHHAGVTCMDCHDPHTTRTVAPVGNNALCLQCHGEPGRIMPVTLVRAPVIDPTAHSHHREGSTGNQCVSCHMPTTNYMVRSPRHDHAWLKPDPLLTKELGIPNACNRCHTDQSVEWALHHATVWYGGKLESRQRTRARAIAAAYAGDPEAKVALLALLEDEDIPAWTATYLHLLEPAAADPEVAAAARTALSHRDPLVRTAAARVLSARPENASELRPLLADPARVVRLEAAWTLAHELEPGSDVQREFSEYLAITLDQPAGRLRYGQHLANLGRLPEAEAQIRQAASWDRRSADAHQIHADVLQALNRPGEAADALARAARLEVGNGELWFRAGLGYAEANRLREAEQALRAAVQREPDLDRAWYNLGLLLARTGRSAEALAALAEAEQRAPRVADYPYATATLHWQAGRREQAVAAARRALAADPAYEPARQLLRHAGVL